LITLAALVPPRDGEVKLIVGVIVAQLRRVGETNPEDRDIVAMNGVSGASPHSAASVVYILSLAVLPRFRRRGIASRLLQVNRGLHMRGVRFNLGIVFSAATVKMILTFFLFLSGGVEFFGVSIDFS
jgi:GNAT superfamily N-acetyltransferase